jgi:predicted NUDIX family NTP pyrophosphohydrolase
VAEVDSKRLDAIETNGAIVRQEISSGRTTAEQLRQSAGILLYRLDGDSPELLLAHPGGPFWARKDAGAWTIPKGECGAGEELPSCALRELAEELGPVPRIEPEEMIGLGSVRQKGGKIVHAWAVEGDFDPGALHSARFTMEWPPHSGAKRDFPEIDRVEWFDPEAAKRKILAAQGDLIDRLLVQLSG